jgi:hypothetical protein
MNLAYWWHKVIDGASRARITNTYMAGTKYWKDKDLN